MIINHHTKYLEIDGYDECVEMDKGEHDRLHRRLRKEGKCNIPVEELNRILIKGRNRSEKSKESKRKYNKLNTRQIQFHETIGTNVRLNELLRYNIKSGNVSYTASFEGTHGVKLPVIEVLR